MKEVQAWSEYCKSMASEIVVTCRNTPVSNGLPGLIKSLSETFPEWKFHPALSRGGWYRLGRVVDASLLPIHESLESWADSELEAVGYDMEALIDEYEGDILFATRYLGETHYLVAQAGDAIDDFLQLEIESLQEAKAHQLFENHPGSVEELVDPRHAKDELQPLGFPRFAFRRMQHIGAFLKRMQQQKPEPAPIHRMLEDWQKSSAGAASAFTNHWVIATREHLDRYQQPIFHAQPIPTLTSHPGEFSAENGTQGLKLHDALVSFDRAAGYPMAWYFHMLTGKTVPHWVAQTVVEDALAGLAYLPNKDIDVIRHWLHRPYGVTSHG